MSENPSGLTPNQLRHIGILLLGHQAAARGTAVAEPHEAEFLGRPGDHLFRQTAEVHHHQGGGSGELNAEIAVTDRIEAVGINR